MKSGWDIVLDVLGGLLILALLGGLFWLLATDVDLDEELRYQTDKPLTDPGWKHTGDGLFERTFEHDGSTCTITVRAGKEQVSHECTKGN